MEFSFTPVVAAVALTVGGAWALHAAPKPLPATTRTELQRHDLGIPGRETIQARISFEPGAAFPRHRHPGEEIIYVLDGALAYQVEGRPTVTLKAGDVLFIPAETTHAAENVGTGTASELATYVVEKGRPLVELVR